MKQKIIKYWPHIFICVFSIAIGQTVVYFINKGSGDSQFITDLITRIIDILIAILNFSVVIFIFNNERNERSADKKEKYNLYWYQTYILPDSIKYIRKFFDDLEILIDEGLDMNTENAERYMKYTKGHNECKKRITEILRIVSDSTYNNIIEIFKNFQDEFNANLCDKAERDNLKSIASKYKNQMMESLYKYELL